MGSRRRGSISIPAWILVDAPTSYDLTPAEALVLITFAMHAEGGISYVSDGLMQDITNLSRPTIQRARPKLVKLGLLIVVSKGGPGRVARYRIPERMPLPALPALHPDVVARIESGDWREAI